MLSFQFSNKVSGLKPSAIREIFKSLQDPEVISFAAGNPSPLSFPVEKLKFLAQRIFEEEAASSLQYGITEGYAPLRALVETRLKDRFKIGQEYDETIITSGGQQAIDLVCKVLCNEGDTVICETPSFIGALNAFRSYGAKLVGVEMEQDGICIDRLEDAIKKNPNTKFIYLIPTFHNPTGITMSLEKRRAVLSLARQYRIPILEDNPYGELRFDGQDIPTIKSLDRDGAVLYCGSFSKVLSAGMRVGFLCGPRELVQKVVVVKQTNDVHTNLFFQMLCARFIQTYGLDDHIAGIQKLYRENCRLMLSEMDERMLQSITYTRPDGGLFLWCTLPAGVSLDDFVQAALSRKVAVVPGSTFLPEESGVSHSFRLNYSMPTAQQIKTGIALLADAANEVLGRL